MTMLVIDTATDRCALALSKGGKIIENTRSIPRAHNEYLLQMLDDLLAEAGIAPRELSAVGFAAGPGSFTGIRISAAASQALALAAGACVIPVSSSLLLATAARRQLLMEQNGSQFAPQGIQTVLRSRRNYAYLAAFDLSRPASQDVSGDAQQPLCLVADDVLMDDAALVAQPIPEGWIRVVEGQADAVALGAQAVVVQVTDLLALAEAELVASRGLPPEAAQPRYVDGDTPWQPKATTELC